MVGGIVNQPSQYLIIKLVHYIYGDKVAIIIFTEPLHGIIIDSKALANTYRKQFEMLWNFAGPKEE